MLRNWYNQVPHPALKRPLIFSALNRSSSHRCGFETSQVLLVGGGGFFSGIFRFRPTLRLTRLQMSEIILTGRKPNKNDYLPGSCSGLHNRNIVGLRCVKIRPCWGRRLSTTYPFNPSFKKIRVPLSFFLFILTLFIVDLTLWSPALKDQRP